MNECPRDLARCSCTRETGGCQAELTDAQRRALDEHATDRTRIQQPRAPFVVGSATWPGAAKTIEECAELVAELGKLLAFPDGVHPDNKGLLQERIEDEVADVYAVLDFLVDANGEQLDRERIRERRDLKRRRFFHWHLHGIAAGARQ